MKTLIIGIALLSMSSGAFALRCGNTLVNEGTPLHIAMAECKGGYSYRIQNHNADIVKYYYQEGGMTHEMIFIDGNLNSINSSRF